MSARECRPNMSVDDIAYHTIIRVPRRAICWQMEIEKKIVSTSIYNGIERGNAAG